MFKGFRKASLSIIICFLLIVQMCMPVYAAGEENTETPEVEETAETAEATKTAEPTKTADATESEDVIETPENPEAFAVEEETGNPEGEAVETIPEDAVVTEEVEEETTVSTASLDEPEILLEQFIEVEAATYVEEAAMGASESVELPKASARYWRLAEPEKKAYLAIRDMIKQVAEGKENETDVTIYFDELYDEVRYTAADLGLESLLVETGEVDGNGNPEYAISEAAIEAVNKKYAFDTRKLMSALLRDCPQYFYWFDKTVGMSTGIGRSYSAATNLETGEIELWCTAASYYSFGFWVSDDYLGGYITDSNGNELNYIVDSGKTETVNNAKNFAAEIVSDAAELSDYEKLETYRSKICSEVAYNANAADRENKTPYGNPWQLIYVFDKDPKTNVVCEGYSKAFKFLCDLTSFTDDTNCFIVSGDMGGGTGAGAHMWNIVRIGSKNYLVDVTNCDDGTIGAPDKLFMQGEEENAANISGRKYVFSANLSRPISYEYDDDTLYIYDESELTLAVEEAGGDEPGGENPGGDEPGGDNPGGDNPGGDTPGGENSGGDNPGSDTPGGDTPGGDEPTVEDPKNPVDISTALIIGIEDKEYTGSEVTQDITVTVDVDGEMITLSEGTDYEIGYKNNINAGTATLTITGVGNYTGTKEIEFAITPAAVTIPSAKTGLIYNGASQTGVAASSTYEITSGFATNAGNYTATAALKDKANYAWSDGTTEDKKIAWTIAAKPIGGATVSGISQKTYNAKAQTQAPTVKLGDTTLKSGTDYTLSYKNNTAAGTATVTVSGKGNYTGTKALTFMIVPAKIAIPKAKTGLVYTGASQTGVAAAGTYTVKNGAATKAGSFTAVLTLKDKKNYTWSDGTIEDKKVAWKIAPKSLAKFTISGIANKT